METTWSGVLDDVELLGRLYDLDALPSTDRRCSSAGGDIFMHRVMNPMDWDEDWIFHDSRFGLQLSEGDRRRPVGGRAVNCTVRMRPGIGPQL